MVKCYTTCRNTRGLHGPNSMLIRCEMHCARHIHYLLIQDTKWRNALTEGNFSEAVQEFRSVIQQYPAMGEAYVALSDALSRQGKQTEAIDMLRQIVEQKPKE